MFKDNPQLRTRATQGLGSREKLRQGSSPLYCHLPFVHMQNIAPAVVKDQIHLVLLSPVAVLLQAARSQD